MRVLQVHNSYLRRGGEDTVAEMEAKLLQSRGHEVERLLATNEDISTTGVLDRVAAGLNTVWSKSGYAQVKKSIRKYRPDVVHIHNTFPTLSPSAFWAANHEHVPVALTLHNYRITCANGLLLRDGQPCELCVGRLPTAAVRYRCYRDSLPATAAVVAMQLAHRAIRTWSERIDAYIALTGFQADVMRRAGLPSERIHVKPNFLVPTSTPFDRSRQNQIVYVGRLAPEKGADLLLEAWREQAFPGTTLVIIGEGDSELVLRERFGGCPSVEWRGWLSQKELLRVVAQSRFLVMPSRWYEGFPMVALEALSVGTPVIAPNHASFPELVTGPTEVGMLFKPNDRRSLGDVVRSSLALSEPDWFRLHQNALTLVKTRYSAEANYQALMRIYRAASEVRT